MKINSKILGIIVLSTVFGLVSGLVATLLTRVYILEESFDIPFYGEINLAGTNYSGSNLVITNPKKVVVEQDVKVAETIKSSEEIVVGIYKKKDIQANNNLDLSNFYYADDEIGQGAIITSDGWIISNYIPQEIKNLQGANISNKPQAKLFADYVVITKSKKIYEVDNVLTDKSATYAFWHINGNSLPVKNFVSKADMDSGKILVGVDWERQVVLSSILKLEKENQDIVKDSDDFIDKVILTEKLDKALNSGFFFDFNGNLAAMVNADGEIVPIYSYLPCIKCLLTEKALKYPSLGLNYVNLNDLIGLDANWSNRGALIAKNDEGVAVKPEGVAAKAGFQEGDLILSINGTKIDENNDLSALIGTYAVGDSILIEFERAGQKFSVSVKLEEL